MRETRVSLDAGTMPVLRWDPDGTPRAGLVLLQEIFGLSDYVRARCADLAALGYAVAAPQLYWRLGVSSVPEDADDMLARGLELMQTLPWEDALSDSLSALATLRQEGLQQVGLVGFCYGGGLAFATAAEAEPSPDVLVSYYGSALPQLTGAAERVRCPSLHHFGTADDYLPMDVVRQVTDAVTGGGRREDVQVELHEGAGHAFDNPLPAFHHAGASAAAWEQTVGFLEETLGQARGAAPRPSSR